MTAPREELPNGVVVHQATTEPQDKCNIYCEYPWCAPDSHSFVYIRHAPEREPNPTELVECEFGTWKTRTLGFGQGGMTMANGGRLYYRRVGAAGQPELVRADLASGRSEVLDLPDGVPPAARLDVSPGERYVAYSAVLSLEPQRFGIGLADRATGRCTIIHDDPDVCNPHHQFEPGEGRLLLVQHNRGCRFSPDGRCERLVGPEGATLFLLGIPDGQVTRLAVGPPHTHSISGHETWIGTTGEILLTLNVAEDYDHGKGPIVAVRAGAPPRTVCAPWQMNHIGIEPSGRVFCADTYEPDEIIIGSTATSRAAVVCPARTSYQRAPARSAWTDSHPHAYISPDLRWVVFNSDRTGVQQIYCAEIPREMIDSIATTKPDSDGRDGARPSRNQGTQHA